MSKGVAITDTCGYFDCKIMKIKYQGLQDSASGRFLNAQSHE